MKEFSFFDLARFLLSFSLFFLFILSYYLLSLMACAFVRVHLKGSNHSVMFNSIPKIFSLRDLIELIIKYNSMFFLSFAFLSFFLSFVTGQSLRADGIMVRFIRGVPVYSFIRWTFHSIEWSNPIKFDLSSDSVMG